MAELVDAIVEKKEEMKLLKAELYVGNALKAGMDEKDYFIQQQIDELVLLQDKCSEFRQRLEMKIVEMKQVMKGLPKKN